MLEQSSTRSAYRTPAPWLLSAALLLILVGTRSRFVADQLHHFAPALRAPDATLAMFFLAGLWIPSLALVGVMLAAAALADQIAFANGVSDWCVTAAYACLIPAYLSMWFAGRYCRNLNVASSIGLAKFVGAFVLATWIEFVISSGSFFLFSGYFPNMSMGEYWSRTIGYYPPYVEWAAVYVVAGIAIVFAIAPLRAYLKQERISPA